MSLLLLLALGGAQPRHVTMAFKAGPMTVAHVTEVLYPLGGVDVCWSGDMGWECHHLSDRTPFASMIRNYHPKPEAKP